MKIIASPILYDAWAVWVSGSLRGQRRYVTLHRNDSWQVWARDLATLIRSAP